MKKVITWVKCLLFCAILCLALARANQICIRKSLEPPWDMSNKIGGFYNEKDRGPIYFLGASHSYCTFSPNILEELCGVKSYVLASQQQPVDASYYYLKEAVGTQKPEAVVLDVMTCIYDGDYGEEGVVHSYSDPLPFSLNKCAMVVNAAPRKLWPQALFPLIKYHSRWSELKDEDYNVRPEDYKDPLRGHVALQGQSEDFAAGGEHFSSKDFLRHMRRSDKAVLLKMKKYCDDRGIRFILVKTPTYKENMYQASIEDVKAFAKESAIPFVDLNELKSEAGLEREDFYDGYHLNEAGAIKFNRTLWSKPEILLEGIK